MFKKIAALFAVLVVISTAAVAQNTNRPISGGLSWTSSEADVQLEQRVARMFPDGTLIADLETALRNERFTFTLDDRGFTSSVSEGRRVATRGVVRLVFGCSSRVHVVWQQRDGRVYDVDAYIHQGCL